MTDKKSITKKDAKTNGVPLPMAVMTEISIIAHLAENQLAKLLPKTVTPAQFAVLNHLTRLNRTETISQLAQAMQVTQPTMSSTVRKLENQDLIELDFDGNDRRTKYVSVTIGGKKLLASIHAKIEPQSGDLLAKISKDDWSILLQPLKRLRQILDENR